MCGIVGFSGVKDLKRLNRYLAKIRHRGRDDQAKFSDGSFNLGMNRLAILDQTKGLYPMRYRNYLMVYNGEIYNHQELRRLLQRQGVKFKTSSDAEVILPLFERFGSMALTQLEGMFALCIYDQKRGQLFLARDKAGEKPLYYKITEGKLAFSSEIKTLINTHSKLNLKTLAQLLNQGFIASHETLVKDVYKLLPAQYLKFDLKTGKVKTSVYWQPDLKTQKGNLPKLLEQSVEKRLMADVPVGCFLSGGIDSSLIAYFASKIVPHLKTFSIVFPGYTEHDESIFAKRVANTLKTDHTEIPCTPQKVKKIISNIGRYIDEPIVDAAVLPTFLLAQKARKSVKVILTGEGADELFAGYPRYAKEMLAAKIRLLIIKIPGVVGLHKFLTPTKLKKIFTPLSKHYQSNVIWRKSELTQLLPNIKLSQKPSKYLGKIKNPLLAMQLTDINGYLPEQLLMKVDKFTMANNLEARAPYLDSKIVEFALSLPNRDKVRGFTGKYLLKLVAQNYLPPDFVWRKKHSFTLPLGIWFRQELKAIVLQSLVDLKPYANIFNLKYYSQIIKEHFDQTHNHQHKLWSLIVLSRWLKEYAIK